MPHPSTAGSTVSRKALTLVLQTSVILVAIISLALMLWLPHTEGRNAHANTYEIYFKDPFLAFAYLASSAYFVALYQAFILLPYATRNDLRSQRAARALRTIKHCALAIVGFVMLAEIYFFLNNSSDDRAGGVAMGLLIACGSAIVAWTAAKYTDRV